ncbi:hypothetical protein DET49_1011 [Salegentibacter sp. 24]|uniref:hypothetical protein n=1 Tax=Salegentibacter sp. 24 TaxID=2183986 RepID=UPI00105FB2E3|nr:hypothetical protein [Salegentibacter sp. 24]TDN95406.1 hypothetical protein DET49_1011 [Salegentibacter sp. 24]
MGNTQGLLKLTLIFLITGLSASAQLSSEKEEIESFEHSFYVAGNIGEDLTVEGQKLLKAIIKASKNDKSATLLIPGNFITSRGFLPEGEREKQKHFLKKNLLDALAEFNGKVVLTPGQNEWNEGGQNRIDDLESFLQDNQSNVEVWPDDGCPIENEEITEGIVLVTIDTQWYLQDWDEYPNMNTGCDIKTREQFFAEFKDAIKDAHGKTIFVSMQHPVMSNSRISFFEKIGAFSAQDYQSEAFRYLRGRLETLASLYDNVIFASGIDGNLQYLEDDGIPQIISGTTGKTEKLSIRKENEHFGTTKAGYAKLTPHKNNETLVELYEIDNADTPVFSKTIKSDEPNWDEIDFKTKEEIGDTISASIYTREETDKSGLYETLFGDFYRDVYSTKIKAPVLFLDTLEGNLQPLKEGGGMQSRSLRFISKDDHEYTIRALRKSATRFLQAAAVKDHYIKDYIENTVAQRYAMDLFTTAHPYARYSLKHINDLLNIKAGKPEIFYIPKQKALGLNNDEYGGELYMLEAHVGSENKEFELFGSPENIISTTDLLEEMKESKNIQVDEEEYIKNRLVDMLIGDWDRHFDQWRWALHTQEDGTKLYKPIPRDRDFAFPNYDGFIPDLVKLGLPTVRKMETFDENVDNVKWFNLSGYPLDQRLLKESNWKDWQQQVSFIQSKLTDKQIETAFEALPKAAKDQSIEQIKASLKARRENLGDIAQRYYNYLQEFQVLTGTEEDDVFNIERKKNGITKITLVNKNNENVFENFYNSEATDEIWIYGLDGDDTFKVTGKGSEPLRINVIGGEENDIYDFNNTSKINPKNSWDIKKNWA